MDIRRIQQFVMINVEPVWIALQVQMKKNTS